MKNLILFLCLIFVFCGCKVDKEPTGIDGEMFFENLESAPTGIISKEKLPDWLKVKVEEIENYFNATPSFFNAQIYKGEWKQQTVYLMRHSLLSCMMCDVYFEDGENIIWSVNDHTEIDNFYSTSKNWVLIYKLGM